MKVRKSKKNKDFIDTLLTNKELSYEDFMKLKKLEELYTKAKNKYKDYNKTSNVKKSSISKIKSTLDLDFEDIIDDYKFDFIPKDTPSYDRAQKFAEFMKETGDIYMYR